MPDTLHQLQAGIVAFHHHIEQQYGNIRVLLQQPGCFGTAVRVQ